jgi:PAS domain S-box-containing protein
MRKKMDPWLVAVLYGVLGAAWILASSFWAEGWNLAAVLQSPGPATHKALGFVLFTAGLIYFLVRLSRASIKRERAWYRELFESNPHPMWVYDLGTLRFLAVNHAAIEHYGYSRQEFLRMTLADIRPAEDVPALLDNVAAVTEGLDRAGVWRHLRKDGSLLLVEIASHTVSFEGRRAEMVLVHDVTARLAAEEDLQKGQALLRTASRVSRIGGWSLAIARGELDITWSEEVRAIHEVPPDFKPDLKSAARFYAPEHREAIVRAIQRCIRKGTHFEKEAQIITARGKRAWVRIIGEAVHGADGRVAYVQGAMQDVTERKEADISLLRSERRFFALADAMPFIVWTAEPNGSVDFANRAFTEYSGVPVDENLANRTNGLVHPEDTTGGLAAWGRAIAEGIAYQVELRLRRVSDGEYRWHQLRGQPIRDDRGVITKWYGTALDVHEIKLAEEKADRTARRLSKTLESITDAFFTLDQEWKFTYVNGEAERLLRHSRDGLIGGVLWDVLPGDTGALFEEACQRAVRTGETVAVEAWYSPLAAWMALRVFPFSEGFAVYFRDVTGGHVAREALRASEERFRLVTRVTSDLIWDVDAVRGTIWWGEGFQALFGEDPPPGSRTTVAFWEERVHPEDRARVFRRVDEAFVGGGDTWRDEYRLRRADGGYVTVLDRGHVSRDASGQAVRLIGGMTDLTERKRAEEDLRRLSRQLEDERARLLEAQSVAKVGSWELDLSTGDSIWSEETYRIFEVDPFDFKPSYTTILAYVHPEDKLEFAAAFERSQESGEPCTHVHRILLPNGRIKYLEENWRVDRTAGRATGTCQDISTRIALEEQYRQSQKMEAVGRLAGGVAHDFNNMLTVILMRSELALNRAAEEDPMRAMLREIHDAAERSAGLTRQLLIYARRQKTEMQVMDLNAAVENSLKMLRRLIGEDVDLEWRPSAGLWAANLDPAQLDQVLANLCVNARDAIATTGSIAIETANVTLSGDAAQRGRKGDYIVLSVSDTGSGIDSETLAHVFEPFYTTKEVGKGTGLGLAIVYGIVQQSGGFIEVESELGRGTVFRVHLPRHQAAAGPAEAAAPPVAPRGKGETLLVVEDEPMILNVAVEILQELGYAVLSADQPAAALELVRQHGPRIRLLLTDVIMPGMNGRELAEKARAAYPDLRVLFMSGYTSDVMEGRGLLEEDVPFLKKPFSHAEISRRVREALDGPASFARPA